MMNLEISEAGVIWNAETNAYIGVLPRGFDVDQTLAMFNKLREAMARIEGVRLCLVARNEHQLIEMLDRALLNLEGREAPFPSETPLNLDQMAMDYLAKGRANAVEDEANREAGLQIIDGVYQALCEECPTLADTLYEGTERLQGRKVEQEKAA